MSVVFSNFKRLVFLFLVGFALCADVLAQSPQLPLDYIWFLGLVRQDGIPLSHTEIKEVMSSNSQALKQYKTGMVLGYVSAGVGLVNIGLLVGSIFEPSLAIPATIGVFGVQMPILMISWSIVGNATRTYNADLGGRTSYQLNIGITPSGGIGLTMKF